MLRPPWNVRTSRTGPAPPMMRLATTPLLVLFASLASTSCMWNTSHVREERQAPDEDELLELYVTTATYLYDDGSFLRAQEQAVKALELDPGNVPMSRMAGWIKLRLGKTEDVLVARNLFRKLVREGDDNEGTLIGLATATERLGTGYDRAAREVLAGDRHPEPGLDAAQSAEKHREEAQSLWKEAVALYESTLVDGEGSTAAMNGLQRTYALMGDFENSLVWTDRLIVRSTDELEVWRRMLTGSDLSQREESLYRENERVARELQVQTHLFASTLLHDLGRLEEAIQHLDWVAEADAQLPQVYSRRAQLLAKTGSYQPAIGDLDRFLALSDAPFEDPSIKQAFALRSECESALASARD